MIVLKDIYTGRYLKFSGQLPILVDLRDADRFATRMDAGIAMLHLPLEIIVAPVEATTEAPSHDPDAAIRRATVELARLDRAEATLVARVDRITAAVLDAQLARLATARQAARDAIAAAEAQRRAQRVTVAAVATMDAALARLREAMPRATAEERRELAAILLGDVEIGAEALSAAIHLPIGVSLVGSAGYSRTIPERAAAGTVRVALPLRRAA